MHEDLSFPASFPQRNPITTQLRTMTTPFSPPHDPGPEGNSLPQVQNRLLLLAGQIDQLQTRLDQLTESAQENSAQLDALLAAFLTPASGQGVDVRLVELTVQVEATREQVEQMQEALATVATQEQLSSLERALAGRELLSRCGRQRQEAGAHPVQGQHAGRNTGTTDRSSARRGPRAGHPARTNPGTPQRRRAPAAG